MSETQSSTSETQRSRILPENVSPTTVVFIGAGFAVAAVVIIAAVFYLLPALGLLGGGFTRLDATNPSVLHPDGLLVTLEAGSDPVSVRLDSQPREQFLAGQAGAAWTEALAQLPSDLTLLSPIYTVEAREDLAGQVYAEVSIPNGAEPLETLSLYAWDESAKAWVFMPNRQDVVRDVVGFEPVGKVTHVAAMQHVEMRPGIGLVLGDGATVDAAVGQALEEVLLDGPTLLADGTVDGQPDANTSTTSAQMMPLVSNTGGDADSGFRTFVDPAANEAAIANLLGFAADYPGLTLDFEVDPNERDAFSAFVETLAMNLHASDKSLSVVMRGTSLSAYNMQALGGSADRLWWAPGDDLNMYLEGGAVQNALYGLVGDLDRRQLGLLVSSDSVDVAPSGVRSLTTDEALDVFGQVVAIEGYLSEGNNTIPGEQIPFRLSGELQAMAYDASLGANYVTYTSDGETHHVYLSSAESLTRKLDWAARYGLRAVAVENNDDPQAVDAMVSGLSAFIAQTPADAPPALSIVWQVTGAEGTTLSETAGDLSAVQYLWIAEDKPGDYVISAAVGGPANSPRGEFQVTVAEGTGAPRPVTAPVASSDEATETAEETPAQDTPAPVVAAGAAAGGGFELGGQVRGSEYYGYMQQAGMTWVKFQLRGLGNTGEASAFISEAHGNGFKVLLSVLGDHNIDFNAWTNYYGQLAALGPDAIEIWNEPNFSREWPAEHMGGGNYVNLMLAPAYNAIKAANPNVMVISGAPTPTGAFQGCSYQDWLNMTGCDDAVWIADVAAAGGANFMDCVGVHFNAGATSPSASSGHPAGTHYSWYYSGMVNTYSVIGRPLCFTEFGYAVGPGLPQAFAWANDNTVEEQAAWLAEAAALSAQRNVRLMIVWNVGGFGGAGGDPQGAYAIVRGGSCPACASLGSVMGVQ